MKVKSDRLPQNDFEINNIQDNVCDVVFFDVANHIEEKDENNNISYEYDSYTIKNMPYRTNLGADISENYDTWYNYAIQYENNALASEIRAKRDELLKDSDKHMLFDRFDFDLPTDLTAVNLLSSITKFFETLKGINSNAWAKYRQELRDLTNQEGFPYNVKFPTPPEE